MPHPHDESRWEPVKQLMAGAKPIAFGPMHTYHCRKSPRRLLYMMAYYKFAAKMIGQDRSVLDVGCGEGLGTWLLARECGSARGIDFDEDSIRIAQANFPDNANISFHCGDFLDQPPQPADAVVSFDVIEHILPEHADAFLERITANLNDYGIAIIGTPNVTAKQYASAVANAGHVNMYDGDRLRDQLARFFNQVFLFGANDEVVHTGFPAMCHYLLVMGVRKRKYP